MENHLKVEQQKKTHKFHLKINFQGDFVNPFLSLSAVAVATVRPINLRNVTGEANEMKRND